MDKPSTRLLHCPYPPIMSKYEVLRVGRSAPFQEIKKAYQTEVLVTHPDKHVGITSDALKNEV